MVNVRNYWVFIIIHYLSLLNLYNVNLSFYRTVVKKTITMIFFILKNLTLYRKK